jgi:alpha-ribazole phosphatase
LTRLLLVRHGQTEIALNPTGLRQARQLRDRLAGEKINAVYASPLNRVCTTAKIITEGHNVRITLCRELVECNFGYIEGLNFAEIETQYPTLAKELKEGETVNFPGGETLEQLDRRVQTFLKKLKRHKLDDTILIVAHGGPLRLIISHLLGLGLDFWTKIRIDLGSLSIIDVYPETSILGLLNDVSHQSSRD